MTTRASNTKGARATRKPPSSDRRLPADWTEARCADMCIKIQDGTHFSPRSRGNDYLYITSKHIGFGRLDTSSADRISEAEHRKIYGRCDTRRGDLLLTKDGANTGNAAINNIDEEVSLLSSVAFLRFDPTRYDAGYFLQYILSNAGQQRIKEMMSGNAIPRLTLQKIRGFMMPTPPIQEQRAIAEALSDVDGLLEALEALIAKKRDMKQAAMQQLLTGKTRLPGFETFDGRKSARVARIPNDWNMQALRNRVQLLSGHHVLAQHCNLKGEGVPYLTGPADFPNGTIRHTKFTLKPTTLCEPKDILVTVKGSGAGTLVEADAVYCISRQLMAIR